MSVNYCRDTFGPSRWRILWTSFSLIILTFIVTCVIVPFLLKNLHGQGKMYLILQQFTTIIYMALNFLTHKVELEWFGMENSILYLSGYKRLLSLGTTVAFVSSAVGEVFYYQQYAFSILHSLTYYNMICHTLQFESYSQRVNVVKRIVISFFLSIILSSHNFVVMAAYFLTNTFNIESFEFKNWQIPESVNDFYSIYGKAQFVLYKCVYTIFLLVLAYRIKKALDQSGAMRNGNSFNALFTPVCLIPLFNNVFYLCWDIPSLIIKYQKEAFSKRCESDWDNYRLIYHYPLMAFVFSMGSLLQSFIYLRNFSSLRKGLCGQDGATKINGTQAIGQVK